MSTKRRQPIAALPLSLAAALLAACSSAPNTTAPAPPSKQPNIFSSQSQRQLRRPDERALQAPPPPAFPLHLTAPLPEQDAAHAAKPLATILAESAAPTLPSPQQNEPAPAIDQNTLAALRAYVRGRTLLLTDGPVAAEPELRAAARLDPDAPETWHALAEAQAELGSTAAAVASYKRALDRDPTNTAALERLSADAMKRRDYKRALEYLTQLKSQDLAAIDPALPNIIDLRLARCLRAQGHTAAAAEAFISAADLPAQFSQATAYLEQLTNLYRQRPLLLLRAGDAYLRLKNYQKADSTYILADAIPSTDDLHQILTRRIYVLMKSGRSASAAEALFERLDKQNGLIDDALLDLFRHAAHHSDAQQLIVSALDQRLEAATAADQRVQGAHLALARAQCLPPDRAPAALRGALQSYPTHTAALRALMSSLETDAERTSEAISLIGAHPQHANLYMNALLGARPASQFIPLLPPPNPAKPEAALLRAQLLLDNADPSGALDALTPITPAHEPTYSYATILRASLLRLLARNDRIPDLLSDLPAASQDTDLARAQIHLILGQTGRAYETLTPHLSESVQHCTTAGYAAELRSEIETARTLYKRAIAIDPTDDAPYRRLLALLRPTGASPDPQDYAEIYRQLRAHIPWSAAVSFERVVSDVQGGNRERAEHTLAELLTDHPREHSAADLLGDLMLASAEYETLETLLRDRLERMPNESGVHTRLAQVISATGDSEGAAEKLAHRLADVPGDSETSRALEQLLRDKLDRREEADDLAFARLAREAQSPGSLLELFELYIAHERRRDAMVSLASYLTHAEARHAPFPEQLLPVLMRLTMHQKDEDEKIRADSLDMLDLVLEHRPDAPDTVHLLRLDALISLMASGERLGGALDRFSERYPEHFPGIYDNVGKGLIQNAEFAAEKGDVESSVAYGVTALELGVHSLERFTPARIESVGLVVGGARAMTRDPGERERAAGMIVAMDQLAERSFGKDALAVSYARYFSDPPPDDVLATVYYFIAIGIGGTEHDERSEKYYRAALRMNPDMTMALNNLGYRIIERDGDLDDAHRLLARSYALRDSETRPEAIIDSLGWVRYKLGMIHDGADANGRQVPGAITLLGESYTLAKQTSLDEMHEGALDNPRVNLADLTVSIVASHYGDALWAGGERERAIEIWREAYETASGLLDSLQEGDLDETSLEELEHTRTACGEKMRSAGEDREPGVAMIGHALRPAEHPGRAVTGSGGAKKTQEDDAF